MKMKPALHYFFLGTEAELIKMAYVIQLFMKDKIPFKIVSSGQNDIRESLVLKYLKIKSVDILLSKKPVYQSPFGLISWFVITTIKGIFVMARELKSVNKKKTWMIIHGDTVSTMVGAMIGRCNGLKVAHVEAGYRSAHLFHPFPEELDRTVGSALSHVLFCPFDSIGHHDYKTRTPTVDIHYNTSLDSLNLALRTPVKSALLNKLRNKKYFIFALHRQEALLNRQLVEKMIRLLLEMDTGMTCVFAMHHPTKKVLEDLNLMGPIKKNKNIILTPRLPYFEYSHVFNKCEFIMTDGVGNQQETYYAGKPCLILRSRTEGLEGLNKNAVLSHNNIGTIAKFIKEYKKYKRKPLPYKIEPSRIIFDYFKKAYEQARI
jgi:UDP-N-acetylglucosamine 2-epimerase (non-hydrolysing)